MIKKAIIVLKQPGLEPLSLGRAVTAEFWLLHGQPLIEHLVDEMIEMGVEQIFFVGPTEKKIVSDYFNQISKIEEPTGDLSRFIESYQSKKFNLIVEPGSFGPALPKLMTQLKDEPAAISWAEDFWVGEEGSFSQLARVFNTAQQTVLGLTDQPTQAELSLSLEKIAQRMYRVRGAEDKKQEDGKLFLAGRAIVTPEFWSVFAEMKREVKEDKFDFYRVLSAMAIEGKSIYGYELKGEKFDLKEASGWLGANRLLVQQEDEQ